MARIPAAAELDESDVEMLRVIEDLILVMLERKLILMVDLPESVREKLLRRRLWRHRARPPERAQPRH
jgi:virulence-associated protein VagC